MSSELQSILYKKMNWQRESQTRIKPPGRKWKENITSYQNVLNKGVQLLTQSCGVSNWKQELYKIWDVIDGNPWSLAKPNPFLFTKRTVFSLKICCVRCLRTNDFMAINWVWDQASLIFVFDSKRPKTNICVCSGTRDLLSQWKSRELVWNITPTQRQRIISQRSDWDTVSSS